jgi:hypothetical protein
MQATAHEEIGLAQEQPTGYGSDEQSAEQDADAEGQATQMQQNKRLLLRKVQEKRHSHCRP